MFYKDPNTQEVRNLTEKEAKLFGGLIGTIGKENVALVQRILNSQPFFAHAFDDAGITALNFASRHHTPAGLEIVRILINYGADPYSEMEDGFMPIHWVNDITDPALKARFCEAMGIGADTQAILRSIRHAKAVAEVEAEYAAKAAEEAATKAAQDAEIERDPLGAVNRLYSDQAGQNTRNVMNKFAKLTVKTAITDNQVSDEAKEAIESLQNKPEKSSQLEFSVDEGLSALLENMFGSKSLDDLIGTKESYALEAVNRGFFSSFGSFVDYLSNQLSSLLETEVDGSGLEATILQLQGLLAMASSGNLPMGFPHRHNPDDDFEPNFGGGNSGVIFTNPLVLPENVYVVAVLGNGTFVIAEDTQYSV